MITSAAKECVDRALLADALHFLQRLQTEKADPQVARTRLADLQASHDQVALDLTWQREAYDDSHHYNLLLDLPGGATATLGYCPDRGLSWPLRSVARWNEKDLLRVGATTLTVGQAIACLDFIWEDASIAERLINVCLVQQALQENPVELSDDELQQAMNAFRRGHGLIRADRTRQWMQQRGLTHMQFEQMVADEARIDRLRQRVTEPHVDSYFRQHCRQLDTVTFLAATFSELHEAERFCRSVRDGMDFYAALEIQLTAKVESSFDLKSQMARVQDLPAEMSQALLTATSGDVTSPVAEGDGFVVARLVNKSDAVLDAATRREIQQRLFDEWLGKRRASAEIEWNWGRVSSTA